MASASSRSFRIWRNIASAWRRSLDVNGRTSRRDFWLLMLGWFAFLLTVAATGLIRLEYRTPGFVFIILNLVALLSLVPMAGVTVRRLHDAGHSGFWILLIFIIPAGWFGLTYLCARRTSAEFVPNIDCTRARQAWLRTFERFVRGKVRRINRERNEAVAPSTLEQTRGPKDARRIVILIHGTFASGAAWVRSGPFVDHAAALPATAVYAFRWTGANSHRARLSAGRDLAREIKRLADSGATIHLLGHSHGGNVALYALRDHEAAKSISSLGFLGTPFIQRERGDNSRLAATISHAASWLVAFPGWLPFGAMATTELLSFSPIGWAIGLFLLGPGITFLYVFFLRIRFRRIIERFLVRHWQTRARFVRSWLRQPTPPCPTFVASVSFDEARLLLRAVDAAASAPSLGLKVAAAAIGTATLSLIALMFATMAFDTTLSNVAEVDVVLLAIMLAALVVVAGPFLVTLWVSSLRGSRVGFGSEGLVGGMASRIYASVDPSWIPSGACVRRLVKPPRTGLLASLRQLRHSSFYNDDELASDYGRWLDSRGAPSEPPVVAEPEDPDRRPTLWLRFGVPVAAAAAVTVASVVLTLQSIAERGGLKIDWEEVALGESPELLEAYEIESTTEDLGRDLLGPYPQGIALDVIVPPNRPCAISGSFTLPDWGTHIDIERGAKRPISPEATLDEINGAAYAESETSVYTLEPSETAWNWQSENGKEVEFQRPLAENPKPTLLGIEVFSEQEGLKVTGTVRLSCAAEVQPSE